MGNIGMHLIQIFLSLSGKCNISPHKLNWGMGEGQRGQEIIKTRRIHKDIMILTILCRNLSGNKEQLILIKKLVGTQLELEHRGKHSPYELDWTL